MVQQHAAGKSEIITRKSSDLFSWIPNNFLLKSAYDWLIDYANEQPRDKYKKTEAHTDAEMPATPQCQAGSQVMHIVKTPRYLA